MKTYKLQDPENKGLLRISLVDDPAIQSTLMAFNSEEEKPFNFVDEEQMIIYAPALIPNKLIFRKNIKGEPAQVFFDAETIKQLHINGSRNSYDSNINLNHEKENTSGIFCFESWIIENNPQDKAYSMGFDVPIGTLMKGYKIDNTEVWNDVKSGKLTGLSIEAYLNHSEVRLSKNQTIQGDDIWFENTMFTKGDSFYHLNGEIYKDGTYQLMTDVIVDITNGVVSDIRPVTLKSQINMNKKGVWEHIKSLFAADPTSEVATGFYAANLDLGSIVTDVDGNALPNVEFEANGNKYKTDDMGAISEVEPIETNDSNDEVTKLQEKIVELETALADTQAKLAQYEQTQMSNEDELTKLKTEKDAEIEKLQAELIEAKKIPVAKVEEVPYEKMTNAQKVKYNRGKL